MPQLGHVKGRRSAQGVGVVGDGATIEDSKVLGDVYHDPETGTTTFSVLRRGRTPRWVRITLDGNDHLDIEKAENPDHLTPPVGMKLKAA